MYSTLQSGEANVDPNLLVRGSERFQPGLFDIVGGLLDNVKRQLSINEAELRDILNRLHPPQQ
jgi:hypothetical protein